MKKSQKDSVSILYKPHYTCTYASDGSAPYAGASLLAFQTLGAEKGYQFIGCNSIGNNAFFVRYDCLDSRLPIGSLVKSLYTKRNIDKRKQHLNIIKQKEWVQV